MADPYDIITTAEAKTVLNLTAATPDAALAPFITAASQMWVREVCPVVPQPFTLYSDGGSPAIVLDKVPVIAVQSVTENGVTLPASSYVVNPTSGVLSKPWSSFFYGPSAVVVAYTAGFTTTPEDIKFAVKRLVKHMWDTNRGNAAFGNQGAEDPGPGAGFLWPRQVEQVAAGYRIGGFA